MSWDFLACYSQLWWPESAQSQGHRANPRFWSKAKGKPGTWHESGSVPMTVTRARNRLMSLEVDGGMEGWHYVETSSRIWVRIGQMRVTGVRCSPGMAGQGSRVEERPRVSWYISMQDGRVSGGRVVMVELSVLSILCQLRRNLRGTSEKGRTVIRKHRK